MRTNGKGTPPKSAPSGALTRPKRGDQALKMWNGARDRAAVFALSLSPSEDLLILCGYTDPDDQKPGSILAIDCFGMLTREFVREQIDVRHRRDEDEITLLAVSRAEYLCVFKKELFADAFGEEIARRVFALLKKKVGRAAVILASEGALRGFLTVPLGSANQKSENARNPAS